MLSDAGGMFSEGRVRISSGCAVSAVIDRSGKRMSGECMIRSIRTMHERSNGLGGGFAGYGIYPEFRDYYAFHLFYDDFQARKETEDFLEKHFELAYAQEIPTSKVPSIRRAPLIWRYFVTPLQKRLKNSLLDEEEYVVRCVNRINGEYKGAYVFSSGKNMGIFKAVGYPEDVGEFYRLDEYAGYAWTCHGRYPTNTPGWWGGAHPFGLLDYSVVHNGEISSYDTNRRYIEQFGYKCSLQTDTEVITYIIDYLLREKHLTLEEIAHVIAASFWTTIDEKPAEEPGAGNFSPPRFSGASHLRSLFHRVRLHGGLMALNDRLKLRSMVCAERGDLAYIASEECAIRAIQPELDKIFAPAAARPSSIV